MDMTGQPQLWTPAVEAFALSAYWEYPYGWQLTTRFRRGGQRWADTPSGFYSELHTPELYDVCSAELLGALGL